MCEQMGLLDWLEGVELTDTAGLVDRTGLDAHLAALGVDDTRAVGANQSGLVLCLEDVGDADHVVLGDTLSNTDDETNFILDGLNNCVCSSWRWHVKDSCVRLCLSDSLR